MGLHGGAGVKLSQRLWWSVAYHTKPQIPAHCTLWGKIVSQCVGKRHYLREITLTPAEEAAAVDILRNPPDDLFRFYVWHEATNYPDGAERCARWYPREG